METLEARKVSRERIEARKINREMLRARTINYKPTGSNHKGELTKVFERATWDIQFYTDFVKNGAEALKEYKLTDDEKRALLTNDVAWIKKHHGPLTAAQNFWFEHRLSAEVW